MGEALRLKWVGHLWQSELLFLVFRGVATISSHRMTTGFGPFKLLTCGLLQKGWDHTPPKFFFREEPSFLVGTAIAMGIYSAMNIQINTQIGGGVNGVVIILTMGMGEWLT